MATQALNIHNENSYRNQINVKCVEMEWKIRQVTGWVNIILDTYNIYNCEISQLSASNGMS